ncbi:hypothetical protein GCM10023347_08070 [Streptomyces chumphonensis]
MLLLDITDWTADGAQADVPLTTELGQFCDWRPCPVRPTSGDPARRDWGAATASDDSPHRSGEYTATSHSART